MAIVCVETYIAVPVEACFDLARDIGLHCATTAHTKERAVAGVTSGLISLGDSVTFEAVHFGIRQRLTAKVVEFEPPHRFVDVMTQGAFQSLKHIHEFSPTPTGTLMRDTLEWIAPLGILGIIADKLFLQRHMREFLLARNANLKRYAEQQSEKAK
ncbi:MAG: SRPBCC family protein [Abitibacteriaceae bacterium]|nr:SRPBCC family protein [Abditibacteriaceae bacterium]MBV9865735.1 SRPBCC family protein [Abditibacteriaceae bacterium]